MTRDYYQLATDFYERGWGRSFHFATRFAGESFATSMLRHELYLAHRLGLRSGMKVVDVGCGIGGPLRSIARLTHADLLGLNSNEYQVGRARSLDRQLGLDAHVDYLLCDFNQVPVEDGHFDAAYQIEATCHASDLTRCYREIHRILKPGACFAGYEWCMTPLHEATNPLHLAAKQGIEKGCSIQQLVSQAEVEKGLRLAGFEIVEAADLALDLPQGARPWYAELQGSLSQRGLVRTRAGQALMRRLIPGLEALGVAPPGSAEVSALLHHGADALVESGRMGTFTPMFFYLAKKPG